MVHVLIVNNSPTVTMAPKIENNSDLNTRLTSASIGSLATSLFVTPMDTIKVRQQIKNITSVTVIRDIIKNEGYFSLWKGLTPTIIMSIPANVVYYVSYDYLRDYFSNYFPLATSSLIAGTIGRSTVVMLGAPFELLRTRLQAEKTLPSKDTISILLKESKDSSYRMLFRGAVPTLYRDIPFSGIYWGLFESLNPDKSIVINNFWYGCLSGTVAATLTIPFDVAKTRRQVSHDSIYMIPLMRQMVKQEGIMVLFSGLLPRIAKVAPACGIMIATYEFGKRF
eukprot:NODE_916_length_3098_cov_0.162721.p1 type:complete len:281 gc:universal NODE_916_length_3098_cov_0.162721:1335-2177(+)